MKLLVFLGNIGQKYEKTRHNAGFLCGDFLQEKWGFSKWKEEKKFFGLLAEGQKNGQKIFSLKPTTLMNRSGKALQAISNFYKIETSDILLIHDDKDLDFGMVRYREKGSAGGQKGVRDCLRILGTDEVQRIKIGIDNTEREHFEDTADFVLSNFSKEEISALSAIFEQADEKIRTHFLEEEMKS